MSFASDFLSKKGSDTPRLDAELLLSKILDCGRLELYLDFDRPLGRRELDEFKALLLRRSSGCPVAYLTGKREFYSLSFQVDPSVLIPRPETEFLVDEALQELKTTPGGRSWILDLGTGSGNLAVTLAAREKRAMVLATDISLKALLMASQNAKAHGVEDRILFLCGDLAQPLNRSSLGNVLHLIVSNPPYIPDSQWASLPVSVRNFEPKEALLSGNDSLFFHKRILRESLPLLAIGGCILLEIGVGSEGELIPFAESLDGYTRPELIRDYQGTFRVFKTFKR